MRKVHTQFMLTALIFSISAVGYWFWYGVVSDRNGAVATLEKQIIEKRESSGQALSSRTIVDEISAVEGLVKERFVPQERVVAFIDDLQSRGSAEDATVLVSSLTSEGSSAQSELVFALTIRGKFDAVMRTVGSIEYAPYSSVVTNLILGKEDGGIWNAKMKLVVASTPPKTAARN